MRTTSLLVIATLLAGQAAALAQPGAPPPPPPPPPGQYYPPQSYAPPPAGQLTAEEQELLSEGEISDGAHIGGGLLSIFLGFGSGQAVQGRWGDTGWIFTLGEIGAFALIIYGAEQAAAEDCYDDPYCDEDAGGAPIAVGLIGFVVLHVWEIIDAFAGPARHNRRVRNLRMRLGYPPAGYYYGQVEPYVTPTSKDDDGAIAGVRIHF